MSWSIGAMIRREIPPERVIAHARNLAATFDELWIVEDLPYAGGISQLATVLDHTTAIPVGHGIAPAPFRNPAALAMEWAALARFHPGRLIAGIGHGVQDWMQWVGARVESPLALLEESTTVVRQLLRGETVSMTGRYVQLDDIRLEFPPPTAPIVLAGVGGPRSLELAGAVADGTLLAEGLGPDDMMMAKQRIDAGREKAGRTEPHRLTAFVGFYVDDEAGVNEPLLSAGWAAVGATSNDVAIRLRQLSSVGLDSLILVPYGRDVDQQMAIAANAVLPQLRD